jgi:hypothetical protein
MRVERTCAWEETCKRLLPRVERLQQRHDAMQVMAYTVINLRACCGTSHWLPVQPKGRAGGSAASTRRTVPSSRVSAASPRSGVTCCGRTPGTGAAGGARCAAGSPPMEARSATRVGGGGACHAPTASSSPSSRLHRSGRLVWPHPSLRAMILALVRLQRQQALPQGYPCAVSQRCRIPCRGMRTQSGRLLSS